MRQNEYDSRQHFAREGEEVDDTRNLQGQSPYLINGGFNYHNTDLGLEAGLFYNVQGKTLDIIGFSKNADVYIEPFSSLNFNFYKKLGADKRSELNLKVKNLMNSERRSVYKAIMATEPIYQISTPEI